jgi:hypothetical protein
MNETKQRRHLKAILATNEIQNRIQAILMKLASEVDDARKDALIEEYRRACLMLQKVGEKFLND